MLPHLNAVDHFEYSPPPAQISAALPTSLPTQPLNLAAAAGRNEDTIGSIEGDQGLETSRSRLSASWATSPPSRQAPADLLPTNRREFFNGAFPCRGFLKQVIEIGVWTIVWVA
ncbi:hypothetical protein BDN72DRAFT_895698 [Pluteus cervinus]|uniref:Uncharacterized protein n=1 Tax=Pluteus cervinus TaxID=181527 RepID=A0ACD3AZZ0_9AGAR|nr:hypothetical protein BDN72DRAFT_895698 [Pluteus cervinus]